MDIQAKRHGPSCVPDPLSVAKPRESPPQGDPLQVAHVRVVDTRCCADALEPRSKTGLEVPLASKRQKVLNETHGNELRVDRHRAERRIGEISAGGISLIGSS